MRLERWLSRLAIESLTIEISCIEREYFGVGVEKTDCPLLSAQWEDDVLAFSKRLLRAFPETLRHLKVSWQSCRPPRVPVVFAIDRDRTPPEYYPPARRVPPDQANIYGE